MCDIYHRSKLFSDLTKNATICAHQCGLFHVNIKNFCVAAAVEPPYSAHEGHDSP